MPTEVFICDEFGATLIAPDDFISYEWSTGDTTQEITVFNTGRFTLKVIKDFGEFTCEAETSILVKEAEAPIIEDIKVEDWSQNHNSIKILLSNANNGEYEYSVDGFNWQDSPELTNLPLNDYTVFVREANCFYSVESEQLFLLYYDKFFTPNNDGVNDYWQIINSAKEEDIQIHIVNRFGRTMAILEYNDQGWDGKHNGVDLPSDDYWFRVVRNNGDVHFGHFTLKR